MLDFSRFNVNIFLTEVIFYVASFIVAIISTVQINKIIAAQAEIARLNAGLPYGVIPVLPPDLASLRYLNAPEFITISQFIISFLLATLFFIIVIKTKHGSGLFKFIFFPGLVRWSASNIACLGKPGTVDYFCDLACYSALCFSSRHRS